MLGKSLSLMLSVLLLPFQMSIDFLLDCIDALSCALWVVFFMDHLLIMYLVLVSLSFGHLRMQYSCTIK